SGARAVRRAARRRARATGECPQSRRRRAVEPPRARLHARLRSNAAAASACSAKSKAACDDEQDTERPLQRARQGEAAIERASAAAQRAYDHEEREGQREER